MEKCKCGGIIVKEAEVYETQHIGSYWRMITPIATEKITYVRLCIKCREHYPEEEEVV